MIFNNVIIHRYPDSPYVAKAKMNLRWKDRIEMSIPMRDEAACRDYLERRGWSDVRVRVISHKSVEYSAPLAHSKGRKTKN